MRQSCEIRIKGHLGDRWASWFDGMTVTNQANGEAVLAGPLADQAALHGLLIKIRDMGLPLIAVSVHSYAPAENDGA
jgi:hypothetical protein